MSKSLFALPFVVLALVTVMPAMAQTAAAPKISLNAPAEIAADPANRLNLELSTGGTVVVLLRPDVAPNHVRRVQTLVSSGFYNGTIFHRVVPGFMAQGGDPTGTGSGDSPLPNLEPEFNDLPHLRGVMSMARAEDPNSANSQFFIMLAPGFSLDHDYTGFGRVVSGMQFVDSIAPGEPPAQPTRIVRAWLDAPAPVAVAVAPAQPPVPAPVAAPAQPRPQAEGPPAPAEQPAAEPPAVVEAPAIDPLAAPTEEPATDQLATDPLAVPGEPGADAPATEARQPEDGPEASPTGG